MSRISKKVRKRRRIKRTVLGIITVIAIYCLGALMFRTHLFPLTYVGNVDIGFYSPATAKEKLNLNLAKHTLTILETDGQEEMVGEDSGLYYEDMGIIDRYIAAQDYLKWPWMMFQKYEYDALEVQVNEEKLAAAVDALDAVTNKEIKDPINADIQYSKKDGAFVIIDEIPGTRLDKKLFSKGVVAAFQANEDTLSLQEGSYYEAPEYTADNETVIKALDQMNGYLAGQTIYKDAGNEKKIKKSELAGFVKCSKDFKVTIDKAAVKKYVKETVTKEYNSIEGDIPAGLTAWKVDVNAETGKIIKDMKSGKTSKRKPVYAREGFDRTNTKIKRTYIDVNISEQTMWYVEDGKIRMSSAVVTGCVATGHDTPTGVYNIEFKQRNHLMVKYNSFVYYWMPYNTTVGIGFHDATWRSEFGGQIYRYNGSHGCINMPYSKAQELYGMLATGTVVYVHY